MIGRLQHIVKNLETKGPSRVKTEDGITSGIFFLNKSFNFKFAYSNDESEKKIKELGNEGNKDAIVWKD